MKNKEVAIIGAGPYGLSVAACLRGAGVDAYVVGRPMEFWKRHMPRGMLLRSEGEASNIATPERHCSFEAYEKAAGHRAVDPIAIEDFIAYGDWFQKRAVPDVDTRYVRQITRNGTGFNVTFEDGETFGAKSVVLTLGIGFFVYRPQQFAHVPKELAFHSSEFVDLAQLRGKRVAVIGKGQSALEHAALLHEAHAEVEIFTRAPGVGYFGYPLRKRILRALTPGPLRPFSHFLLPPTDLGGFRTGRTIANPEKFRRQPPEVQQALLNYCKRPIGAYWLVPRLEKVPVRSHVNVDRVEVGKDELKLWLSNGETTVVDRLVLATGYKIDISRYGVLDPTILKQIDINDGYPVLTRGLETSVKGLFMAGVVGERTLGPTLRFVVGTANAAPAVAAAITGKQVRPRL